MGYLDGGVHIGGRAQAGARNGLLRRGIDQPQGQGARGGRSHPLTVDIELQMVFHAMLRVSYVFAEN